jgi:hypothetical protein
MHNELNGLTKTLPGNIVREHEAREANSSEEGEGTALLANGNDLPEPPSGLRGLFLRFFEVQKYASFGSNLAMLNNTCLAEPVPAISEDKEETAYLHPALTAKMPKVWIAGDSLGKSTQLVEELPEQISITNEGAWVDEKGRIKVKLEDVRGLPVWKDKVYY